MAKRPAEVRKAERTNQPCPSGKIRYRSELNAERALARALLDNWRGDKPWRREQRVYRCPKCRYWHLTSRMPKTKRLRP